MSYKTLEVELENGRVSPVGPDTLPAKAHALLTILEPAPPHSSPSERSLGDAPRELKIEARGEYTDLSTNKAHLDDLGR